MITRLVIPYFTFFTLSLLSASAMTQTEGVSQSDYQRELDDAKSTIQYGKSLLDQNSRHTLIEEAEKARAVEEQNRQQEQKRKLEEQVALTPSPALTPAPTSTTPADPSVSDSPSNVRSEPSRAQHAATREEQSASGMTSSLNTPKREIKPNKPTKPAHVDPLLLTVQGVAIPVTNDIVDTRPSNQNAIHFGITIGTQFKVRLKNGAKNTQDGHVIFEVMENVPGYKNTLPVGTLLFGSPWATTGDARLYCDVTKGITPSHFEFSLKGALVGNDTIPGLVAVVRSDGKSLQRAGTSAVFSALNSVAQSIPTEDVATSAGKDGVEVLFGEKKQDAKVVNGAPVYVVEAAIQDAYLSVIETF